MPGSGNKGRFEAINRTAIPHTRKSKHHSLVEEILAQLSGLAEKKALKIPRSALGPAKVEHIRAALTRVCNREKLPLATSSDEDYLYVWRQ